MSKKLAGIQGILGTYVTSPDDTQSVSDATQGLQSPVPDEQRPIRQRASHIPARLGRPPGNAKGVAPRREKATLRIEAELMADYRDWSWEKRCQLGELVEQALVEYRQRHR